MIYVSGRVGINSPMNGVYEKQAFLHCGRPWYLKISDLTDNSQTPCGNNNINGIVDPGVKTMNLENDDAILNNNNNNNNLNTPQSSVLGTTPSVSQIVPLHINNCKTPANDTTTTTTTNSKLKDNHDDVDSESNVLDNEIVRYDSVENSQFRFDGRQSSVSQLSQLSQLTELSQSAATAAIAAVDKNCTNAVKIDENGQNTDTDTGLFNQDDIVADTGTVSGVDTGVFSSVSPAAKTIDQTNNSNVQTDFMEMYTQEGKDAENNGDVDINLNGNGNGNRNGNGVKDNDGDGCGKKRRNSTRVDEIESKVKMMEEKDVEVQTIAEAGAGAGTQRERERERERERVVEFSASSYAFPGNVLNVNLDEDLNDNENGNENDNENENEHTVGGEEYHETWVIRYFNLIEQWMFDKRGLNNDDIANGVGIGNVLNPTQIKFWKIHDGREFHYDYDIKLQLKMP